MQLLAEVKSLAVRIIHVQTLFILTFKIQHYNFIHCWSTTSWSFREWRTAVVEDELTGLVSKVNQSWIASMVFYFKRRIFAESVTPEIQHLLVVICTYVNLPLLLFTLCFWKWLPLWIPWKQAEVKQQRCGKLLAWGKTARRGLSLAPAFSRLKCLILVLAHVLLFSGKTKASRCGLPHKTTGLSLHLFCW